LWCWRREQGEKVKIEELTDGFVEVNGEETARPEAKNVEIYREWQAMQDELSEALREVFVKHRRFVTERAGSRLEVKRG
jgi:xylulokinase